LAVPEPAASSTPGSPPPLASAAGPGQHHALLVVLDRSVLADDLPVLVAEIRRTFQRSGVGMVFCDVAELSTPDFGTIDSLARLALALRRAGSGVTLERASPELRDLLAFAGLTGVLPCSALPLQPLGEPEHREEAGGVEEERDPGDAPVGDVDHLE
jgi:hypothetical protein